MVAYLMAIPWEKIYSDYLQAAREVEKEDFMEMSQNLQYPTTDTTTKTRATIFFPL